MSEIKHVESSIQIYFTRNYGQFKWLKGNRALNEAKIKKIIKSIQNGTNILRYAPIIVNESMEIIDGQHRFMVSQQLKENVYYVIQFDADLKMIPLINSNSSNWSKQNYLDSYCDMDKEAYLIVREWMDTFDGLGVSTAAALIHSGVSKATESAEAFKDGQIKADFVDFGMARLTLLKDFVPHTKNAFSSRMVEVMIRLYENGKYDHQLMLKQLESSGQQIQDVATVKTIIAEMERIYNYRMKSRLFIA